MPVELMGWRENLCTHSHPSEIQFFVYLINWNCYHLFCPTLRKSKSREKAKKEKKNIKEREERKKADQSNKEMS